MRVILPLTFNARLQLKVAWTGDMNTCVNDCGHFHILIFSRLGDMALELKENTGQLL